MYTSVTLLTTGSIIIGIGALLAVLLVLLTMSYRKRRMIALEDEQELPTRERTTEEDIHSKFTTP